MEMTPDEESLRDNNNVQWLKFPFEIKDVDNKTNQELLRDFTGERTGFVQVGPQKWFFPGGYKNNAEIYYNFQPRSTDVWSVTFPRSGTTWSQELIWLLANNLDYVSAAEVPLDVRYPFLEFSSFVHPAVKEEFLRENGHCQKRCALVREVTGPTWRTLTETSQRRFIKTHLPFPLLPPGLLKAGCKVIYVARNPKDVAVSFYHLNRLFRTQGYLGDFPKYWYYFKRNLQPWTPYWSHVKEAWSRRHDPNLLFMFYEDMITDLEGCITKLSHFLNVEYSRDQHAVLMEHLKFDNFRKNNSVNMHTLQDLGIIRSDEAGFVRKGRSGAWRDYFVGELERDANRWIEENLKDTDLRFPDIFINKD